MSAFDELKDKAAALAEQAKDGLEKVSETVIEKAGDAVDAATGGKFADKIDSVQAKAEGLLGGGADDAGQDN